MESARHDLILMYRLQKIYDQIAEALKEQRTPPPEIRELEKENLARKRELEAMEKEIADLRVELEELAAKTAESRLELEHFQRQKASVTNEREFTAVINEIDFATRSMEEAETRRKEIDEKIRNLDTEIEDRRKARPEEEASHREVAHAWDERRRELTAQIHGLAEEAQKVEQDLQPGNRSRFLRLLKSRHGKAVAEVIEASCSLCHFELRPHVQQRVRRAEEIITCEHCHRILVLPNIEELLANDAKHA